MSDHPKPEKSWFSIALVTDGVEISIHEDGAEKVVRYRLNETAVRRLLYVIQPWLEGHTATHRAQSNAFDVLRGRDPYIDPNDPSDTHRGHEGSA